MTRRRIGLLLSLSLAAAIAFPIWLTWPHFLLWSAGRKLNLIYSSHRPFLYRWANAPWGAQSSEICAVSNELLNNAYQQTQNAESLMGKSARSRQLIARAELMAGAYDEAIRDYRAALDYDNENQAVQLEMAISYAVRARCQQRPFDYEFAMEQMLEIEGKNRSPELEYDIALLFEEVRLPQSAIDRWKKILQSESSTKWGKEAENKLSLDEAHLASLRQRQDDLTDSPQAFLAHTDETDGSVELVMSAALENWLPDYYDDLIKHSALDKLATILQYKPYQDRWLMDLLRTPDTVTGRKGLRQLALAAAANSRGEHIQATEYAVSARRTFNQLGNKAGELRAQFEETYALDRRWLYKECLRSVKGLRQSGRKRHYVWIQAQAWLEENACMTQGRSRDVIREREDANDWIRKTGFEGLRLRSLSFLTEQYVSFDRKLRIWQDGFEGLDSFWKQPLPANRGYTFYYTIGSSARSSGDGRTALALLGEGIQILRRTPYRQLLALALSDLGEWQFEEGFHEEAQHTFARMESLFDSLKANEVVKFRRQAEATRAEQEMTEGRPQVALRRMQEETPKEPFPYPSLSPVERRRFLSVLGDAYLKCGNSKQALRYYNIVIRENRDFIKHIHDRAQRDNAQNEIEAAWKGETTIYLRQHDIGRALGTWEAFRSGHLADPTPLPVMPPKGVILLVYAFLPDGLSAWIKDDKAIDHRWLDASEVTREAQEFRNLVADRESSIRDVDLSARRLYSTLIGPFEPQLSGPGTLVIDAEGLLAGIPWAALENTDGTLLLTRFGTSQVIGWAEASVQLSSKSSIDLSKTRIMANPLLPSNLQRDYPPLQDALRQVEPLRKKSHDRWFFPGSTANISNLTKELPKATFFVFAGHGISYGGFGALLVASSSTSSHNGSMVTADTISRMKLSKLQLVVLAACSSGIGEHEGTVNLDGLVRGFLEAGTRRVIAARWDVSSTDTADLMTEFYRRLDSNTQPSEALRQAALFIRNNRGTVHPYYWAGFQVFGAP